MSAIRACTMRQHRTFAPARSTVVVSPHIRVMSASRRSRTVVRASSDNPARQALSGVVSNIYKLTAGFQQVDSSLPAIWQGIQKLDKSAVQEALRNGADPNTQNPRGDTPLLFIAREGKHCAHAAGFNRATDRPTASSPGQPTEQWTTCDSSSSSTQP
eukprot:GHUV01011568.1.p1 GENE.GHUV01011568.1~~GHUV01011568.1.p1  ORF type:complete len:158 (+),score=27.55 GHUV01011568.1:102-575(+)